MTSELHTTVLGRLVERFHGGEAAAMEELLGRAAARLERLARAMLRRFPVVRGREQTCDVVQEAVISLMTALRELSFPSTRDFFNLAAVHIRRRLIDLNRRYAQAHRDPAPLAEVEGEFGQAPAPEDDDLERWTTLHQAVEELPADQREVFSLRLYHGWGVQEVAEQLQISTRTVNRLWVRAQMRLREQLGGRALPANEEEWPS